VEPVLQPNGQVRHCRERANHGPAGSNSGRACLFSVTKPRRVGRGPVRIPCGFFLRASDVPGILKCVGGQGHSRRDS